MIEKNIPGWNFDFLFKSTKEWQEYLKKTLVLVKKINIQKKKLENFENFLIYLETEKELSYRISKLRQYTLLKDLDHANKELQNINFLFEKTLLKISKELCWIDNEIKKIGKRKIFSFLTKKKELKNYLFKFQLFFKNKNHLLNLNSEKIISKLSYSRNFVFKLYDVANFADNKSQKIYHEKKMQILTNKLYSRIMMQSSPQKEQNLRKKIYLLKNKKYYLNKNLFCEIYKGIIIFNIEEAKLRGFTTPKKMLLKENLLNEKTYNNLILNARIIKFSLKEFINIKKKFLKIKKFFKTDNHLTVVKEIFDNLQINKAIELIKNTLKIMGEKYYCYLKEALRFGKIDFYENERKTNGAYCFSDNDRGPVILMNWEYNYSSLTTLIHEIGHAVHALLLQKEAVYPNLNSPIVISEVASILNELLLFSYLFKKYENNKTTKIFLLQKHIEMLIGTFFAQVIFSEFENETFKLLEKNKNFNYDTVAFLFEKFQNYYYENIFGKNNKIEKYFWPRITHFFHSPFYVHQYSLSLIIAFYFYQEIIRDNNNLKMYFSFLRKSGSKMPLDLIKEKTKIDLTKNKKIFKDFNNYLCTKINLFKKLLKR